MSSRKIVVLSGIIIMVVLIGAGVFYFLDMDLYKDSSKDKLSIKRIVLITIDTLRVDHLGSYGYIRNTSPFLDKLASQSVFFKNSFCSMPTTVPSHASVFTSFYPMHHGVLKNGHRLDKSFVTLAEMYQSQGFKTAAFVSANQFIPALMDQGFGTFDDVIHPGAMYRNAEDTLMASRKWLDSVGSEENFFVWIHLFDPHLPLMPPEEHYQLFAQSSKIEKEEVISFLKEHHHVDSDFSENVNGNFTKWIPEQYDYEPGNDVMNNRDERMLYYTNLYDAEIHYMDSQLEQFFNYYLESGFNRHSLWAITADHGEGLGSHDFWGHGLKIYNEQLQVPLIFYFSSGLGKGRCFEEVVENVDILPTLIRASNKDYALPESLQGESLLSFFCGGESSYKKNVVFSQRRIYKKRDKKRNKWETEEGERYSLQSKDFKYIYWSAGSDEFYHLTLDPGEINNLIKSGSKEKKRFKYLILKKIKKLRKNAYTKHSTVGKKSLEQLKSLGYIQ